MWKTSLIYWIGIPIYIQFITFLVLSLINIVVLGITWKLQKIPGRLMLFILTFQLLSLFFRILIGIKKYLGYTCYTTPVLDTFSTTIALCLIIALNHNFWKVITGSHRVSLVNNGMFTTYSLICCIAALGYTTLAFTIDFNLNVADSMANANSTWPDAESKCFQSFVIRIWLYSLPLKIICLVVCIALTGVTLGHIKRHQTSIRDMKRDNGKEINSCQLLAKFTILMGSGWILFDLFKNAAVVYFVVYSSQPPVDYLILIGGAILIAHFVLLLNSIGLFHHFVWEQRVELKTQINDVFKICRKPPSGSEESNYQSSLRSLSILPATVNRSGSTSLTSTD